MVLKAGAAPSLISSTWGAGAGNQSEIMVSFAMPTVDTMLGLTVMSTNDSSTPGSFFFIDYTVPPSAVGASVIGADGVGADGVGADAGGAGAGSAEVQAAAVWPRSVTVGAILNRSADSAAGGFNCNDKYTQCHNDTLMLTEADTELTLRAFVDNNLAECYWQDNRVAITVSAPATAEAAAALVSVGTKDVAVTAIKAWQVGGIWITKEAMLATPRADAGRETDTF